MRESLAMLDRYNITAVTSGPASLVDSWRKASPARIIPGFEFGIHDLPPVESLKASMPKDN